jgi:hypothetical protein
MNTQAHFPDLNRFNRHSPATEATAPTMAARRQDLHQDKFEHRPEHGPARRTDKAYDSQSAGLIQLGTAIL